MRGVRTHPPVRLIIQKLTLPEPQAIPVLEEHLRTQHFIDHSSIVITLVSSPYDHTFLGRDRLGMRLFLYRVQLPLVPIQRVTATLLLDKQSPLTLTIRTE